MREAPEQAAGDAHCRFFTLKDLPPRAVDGEGNCIGYLESLPHLVEWDRPRCGLYRVAKPLALREEWIAKLELRLAGQGKGRNAAPACGGARS